MQEKLDSWKEHFKRDEGREPTLQEFQDAKERIKAELANDGSKILTEQTNRSEKRPSKAKRNRKAFTITLIILILILIGVGAFFVGRQISGNNQHHASSSSSVVTSTSSSSSSKKASSSSASSSSETSELTLSSLASSTNLKEAAIVYYYAARVDTSSGTTVSDYVTRGVHLKGASAADESLEYPGDDGNLYGFLPLGTSAGGGPAYTLAGDSVNYYTVGSVGDIEFQEQTSLSEIIAYVNNTSDALNDVQTMSNEITENDA